jgi:hypothetical protein
VDDIAEGRRLDDEHLFQRVGSPLEVRRGGGVWSLEGEDSREWRRSIMVDADACGMASGRRETRPP